MKNRFMTLSKVLRTGQWHSAAGEGARAAAAVLAGDSKGNASYDINGPQALTLIEIAGVPGFLIPLLGAFHLNTNMGTQPGSAMRSSSSRTPRRQCLREPGCV